MRFDCNERPGGRSLFPRQVFFPMAGEKEGWSKLAKNLKAEIDEDLIEAYRGTVSLLIPPGKYNHIAVKIVDDRGVESLKVVNLKRIKLSNKLKKEYDHLFGGRKVGR